MHGTDGLLTEGKTKKVYRLQGTDEYVIVESKNDITAGDGTRHDVIAGKGAWANTTNSNVCRFLKGRGLPTAWLDHIDDTHFLARRCGMVPLEVVVRRRAYGSYLQRHPGLAKGAVFPAPFVELFLKTTGRRFGFCEFPQDDPLLLPALGGRSIMVFDAHAPRDEEFCRLDPDVIGPGWGFRLKIHGMALEVFRLLESRWERLGCTLADLKLEFGLWDRHLLIADVIDNDSWRLFEGERQLDKQVYRDGAPLKQVAACYARVAELSGQLAEPGQRQR